MKNCIDSEQPLLSIAQIAQLVPGQGHGHCCSGGTVRRWMIVGVKGKHLRYYRVGGRFFSTKEWLFEFFQQLTEADEAKRFAEKWKELPAVNEPNEAHRARTLDRAREMGLI